jgi:lanosterol synthase
MNPPVATPRRSARRVPAADPRDPVAAALDHLFSLQREDGAWEGEMVWNTMILAQVVIVRRIVGVPIDEATRAGMIRHFEVSRRSDGSWGMHPDSAGYVFFTTLGYIALRLLGLPKDHPLTAGARAWLEAHPEGILGIPSWGKYWLAFLDLWPWEAVAPCPPELGLLPEALPLHPSRFYCHTRNIYSAISYLYGRSFRARLGPIGEELREELYGAGRYGGIDFRPHRHHVAKSDLFVEPLRIVRLIQDGLRLAERVLPRRVRDRANARCLDLAVREQRTTRYQGISPVNALIDCLVLFDADPHHPELAPSVAGLEAWRWEDAREGVRYAGARSNTWDTAFALQAIAEAPWAVAPAHREGVRRAYAYLVGAQMIEELPDLREQARDPMRGGFCFSDGRHRWPVSDCTAEAVAALLAIEATDLAPPEAERIPLERLGWARDFLLSRQNDDGGFGTYERRRGGRVVSGLVERMNNTEMYGSCMTERSYLECTASSVGALHDLSRARRELGSATVDRAIARGVGCIRSQQREDGSFPGFWGVGFSYGAFHALRALERTGASHDDPALARAAAWLTAHQKAGGGWGEHWRTCMTGEYEEHSETQPVNTAWALLALESALPASHPAIERGASQLAAMQRDDGSFPEGAPAGVFFGSAVLDYRLYPSYFPLWALTRRAALARRG